MNHRALLLVTILLAAGCSSERAPPPQPVPRPQPVQTPRPAPPPPAPSPPPTGWADMPLTPGTWTYSQEAGRSEATFGSGGATLFTLSCDARNRSVNFHRIGQGGGVQMAVRTSTGARTLMIAPDSPSSVGTLTARDPFLDNVIFSRGRFSVQVEGTPMLVLPTWAEPARVVEDCRK